MHLRLLLACAVLALPACGSSGGNTGGSGGSGGRSTSTSASSSSSTSSSTSSTSGGSSTSSTTSSSTTTSGGGDCTGIDATFAAVLAKPLSGCSGFEPPCHNSGSGMLKFTTANPSQAYAALVNVASTSSTDKRVLPGDPKHSFLYRKLTNDLGPMEGSPMPEPPPLPGSMWHELPQDEIDTVRCWIEGGAPNN